MDNPFSFTEEELNALNELCQIVEEDGGAHERLIESGDISGLSTEMALAVITLRQRRFSKLSPSELQFVFESLRGIDISLGILAALVFAESGDEVIKQLPSQFPYISQSKVRLALLFILGTSSSIWALDFLLIILRDTDDEIEVDLIMIVLCQSQHHLFAVVFFTIQSAEPRFRARLQRLLREKGVEYGKPFLAALPDIPDRDFFEGAYGPDVLNEIESERRSK